MAKGERYIGTSGWSYTSWRHRFYPKGLPQNRWLAFLAEHFRTVEINSSFYRIPRGEYVARWAATVGPDFRFAAKLWRGITHLKRLIDADEWTQNYLEVMNEVGPKRGPLLIQLPPGLKANLERLDDYLTRLRRHMGRRRWPVAVEVRHPSWLTDSLAALLNRHGAALCLADWPTCPTTQPNDVPLVYVRRHGTTAKYAGCYSAEQIAADASLVRRYLGEGRDVYVYYNNDVEGHAVTNAKQLIQETD